MPKTIFSARCYASAVLAMALCPICLSVCLSVRPSVTSRCSTKTAKRRITQTTPHDSPVFWCQRSPWNSTGVTPHEGAECRWGGSKSATFWLITGYISKTVQDRHILPIKVEWEVVCALSNGDIAVDLECPLTTPFSAFCTAIHSFVTGEPRDFIFGTLTYHSTSHPVEQKSSLKGAWSGSNNPF